MSEQDKTEVDLIKELLPSKAQKWLGLIFTTVSAGMISYAASVEAVPKWFVISLGIISGLSSLFTVGVFRVPTWGKK